MMSLLFVVADTGACARLCRGNKRHMGSKVADWACRYESSEAEVDEEDDDDEEAEKPSAGKQLISFYCTLCLLLCVLLQDLPPTILGCLDNSVSSRLLCLSNLDGFPPSGQLSPHRLLPHIPNHITSPTLFEKSA